MLKTRIVTELFNRNTMTAKNTNNVMKIVALSVSPWCHIAGFLLVMSTVLFNNTLVYFKSFEGKQYLNVIQVLIFKNIRLTQATFNW